MRAAAFAAATMVAIFGIAYAGPSRAWEGEAPANSIFIADHASAPLESSDDGVNQADAQSEPVAVPPTANMIVPHDAVIAEPSEIKPAPSLAELVDEYSVGNTGGSEEECLAGAVYFEAKGESLKGQLSVAEVVLNRARSGRFPSSICGVVKQRGQFSFIRGGRFPTIPRTSPAWHKAVAIAHIAMQNLADGPAPRALFFHATHVAPGWRGLTRVATVGNHIFYR